MGSKLEFITPEGFRIDGRRPDELRRIKTKIGLLSRADGSAYYEQGNTKIICAVYGPREVTEKRNLDQEKAIINCEYNMATFATSEKVAAINAATLAIMDAGIPMRDFVCACSAGFIDGTPLLDLNHVEGSAQGPELPVAILPRTEGIVMLQMDSRVPLDMFDKVLKLAIEGAKVTYKILKDEVKAHTESLK